MIGMFEEVPDFIDMLGMFLPLLILHENRIVVKYEFMVPNLTNIIKVIMQYLQCCTSQGVNRYGIALFEEKIDRL